MVNSKLFVIVVLFGNLLCEVCAVTHWIVTENGKIESHAESPFNIRRPYDLMALLEQENRRNDLNNLYQDLLSRKTRIDERLAKVEASTKNEGPFSLDNECLSNEQLFPNVDFYAKHALNGSDRLEINMPHLDKDSLSAYQSPDCSKYADLDQVYVSYDDLDPVKNRDNVTVSPDESLAALLPYESIKLFGHAIAEALSTNKSSWVHYNLGTIFWRMMGFGSKAMECNRRALHFVPSQYKDIPLYNLAGILHNSDHSVDAIGVMLSALETSPDYPPHHLAIGNIFAALGFYNVSVTYYTRYLELQPNQDVVATKQAVVCIWKLETGFRQVHDSLESILSDLHDFHSQQQQWLRLQEKFLWEQSSFDVQLIGFNSKHLGALLNKPDQECLGKPGKPCFVSDYHLANFDSLNTQNIFHLIEKKTKNLNAKMAKQPFFDGDLKKFKRQGKAEDKPVGDSSNPTPPLHPKYPTTMTTNGDLYFDATGWPTKSECLKWNLPVDGKEDLNIPVFLPPENKGFQVNKILSEYIGVPESDEYPLPWYPPLCEEPDVSGERFIPESERQALNVQFEANSYLRNHLLQYVNQGRSNEAEIGQRIITAMKKKAAPSWILATLASLYWRVRNNQRKALNCLDLAFKSVPKEYTDVVLVSIGSIVNQLGFVDHALKFANLAFKLNNVEPSTNFLLALLHYKSNNPLMAMYYMKSVLRADPEYYNGQAEHLLKTWGCRIKVGSGIYKIPEKTCSDKESFNGEGVICSENGEYCKTTSVQCFKTDKAPPSNGETIKIHAKAGLLSSSCGGQKGNKIYSFMSSLLSEVSNAEPLEQVDKITNGAHSAFHMRISLGDNYASTVSVALTDDPVPDALLQIYDSSGTLLLSPKRCREIKDADWIHFTSMWQSIAARNVDIGSFLKSHSKSVNDNLKPYCSRSIPMSSMTMDHITTVITKNNLPPIPDKTLSEWLGLVAGDQGGSVRELGAKIGFALKEHATSWLLANAGAIYWRIIGNAEEAIICLRQALYYVPDDMRDIPLISLANVLHRLGNHDGALEAAYTALKTHPDYVYNHFTAGNIHTDMGDFEKAISFYRSSLVLDANFAPARNRLLAISCTLLFDELGSLRDLGDESDG